MRTIFYYDMYARHDVIIESACVWLEDVNSIQFFAIQLCFLSPPPVSSTGRCKGQPQALEQKKQYNSSIFQARQAVLP